MRISKSIDIPPIKWEIEAAPPSDDFLKAQKNIKSRVDQLKMNRMNNIRKASVVTILFCILSFGVTSFLEPTETFLTFKNSIDKATLGGIGGVEMLSSAVDSVNSSSIDDLMAPLKKAVDQSAIQDKVYNLASAYNAGMDTFQKQSNCFISWVITANNSCIGH